jgi:hypothetical protein
VLHVRVSLGVSIAIPYWVVTSATLASHQYPIKAIAALDTLAVDRSQRCVASGFR